MWTADGTDYLVPQKSFTIEPEQESVEIVITIINDNVVEPEEFFDLIVSEASDGVVIDSRSFTQVQIQDTDCKLHVLTLTCMAECKYVM